LLGETRLSFNTKPECHSLANGKENKALEVVDDIEDLWTFEDTLTLVVLIVSVVLLLAIIFYLATKGNTNEEKSRLFTLIFLILCVVILIFSVWVGVKYY
jgi:cytochrome bd-type quinol oxidase subunit 2